MKKEWRSVTLFFIVSYSGRSYVVFFLAPCERGTRVLTCLLDALFSHFVH